MPFLPSDQVHLISEGIKASKLHILSPFCNQVRFSVICKYLMCAQETATRQLAKSLLHNMKKLKANETVWNKKAAEHKKIKNSGVCQSLWVSPIWGFMSSLWRQGLWVKIMRSCRNIQAYLLLTIQILWLGDFLAGTSQNTFHIRCVFSPFNIKSCHVGNDPTQTLQKAW